MVKLSLCLRARALDVLSALPDDAVSSGTEISEVVTEGDITVTITVSRRSCIAGARDCCHTARPRPPDGGAPSEGNGQDVIARFARHRWLTELEQRIVDRLLLHPSRMTAMQLWEAVEADGLAVGENTLKTALARLTHERVGVLDNDRSAHPPGYAVTEHYRQHLAWIALFDIRDTLDPP